MTQKLSKGPFCRNTRRSAPLPALKKLAVSRLSARLGASTETTKRTGRATVLRKLSRRLVIYFLRKMTKKLSKGPFCRNTRRSAPLPALKGWLCHALASALVHRPRPQKRSGVCTRDAGGVAPCGHFLKRHQKKTGKGTFCNTNAGARLFLHKKSWNVTPPRPPWCIDRPI